MELLDTTVERLGILLFAGYIAAAAVFLWATVRIALRNHRLSKEDPPTEEELEVIRGLRRPGSMNLGGRESASARHYETVTPAPRAGRHPGGGVGVYTPKLVQGWRQRRTER
ncbi:MAG: hypothetical protein AAGF23_05925 [Acidobacteriota bacterium]